MELTVASVKSVAPPSATPRDVSGNASSADELSATKVIFPILTTRTIGHEFVT